MSQIARQHSNAWFEENGIKKTGLRKNTLKSTNIWLDAFSVSHVQRCSDLQVISIQQPLKYS